MLGLDKNIGDALRKNKAVNVPGSDFTLMGCFSDFVKFTQS
jgi:hypothetical protein